MVLNVPGDRWHVPLWREQFDHAPKDLLSSLRHFGCDNALDSLRNKSWTKLQKWWELFGKYWLIANRHNDDDVKLMGWLMTRARHSMVDVCGENMSVMKPVKDRWRGIRLLTGSTIDNHSKLLKMELRQQIPIKSFHKMKRDSMKRNYNNNSRIHDERIDYSCWYD